MTHARHGRLDRRGRRSHPRGRSSTAPAATPAHIGHVIVDPEGPRLRVRRPRLPGGHRPGSRPRRPGRVAGLVRRDRQGARRRRRARPPGRRARHEPRRLGARRGDRLRDAPVRPRRRSRSAAGCPRPGRCCSGRWRRRSARTPGWSSPRCASCRPRSGRSRASSGPRRSFWRSTVTYRGVIRSDGDETAGLAVCLN